MPVDLNDFPLPPPGAKLRVPPSRPVTYEEAYQQVRRQLKDDGSNESSMSVQMKAQVRSTHADSLKLRTAD